MKTCRTAGIAIVALLIAGTGLGQTVKMHSGFLGVWNLHVEKSDFWSQPKPKQGQVNRGEHGFSLALVLPNGELFTDGIATDSGCRYVGSSPLTCGYQVASPRQVRLTMKYGAQVIR